MITLKEVQDLYAEAVSSNGAISRGYVLQLSNVAEKLLKERDEALRREDAYREVAIINGHHCNEEFKDCGEQIDNEVKKILEREAKSKEGK